MAEKRANVRGRPACNQPNPVDKHVGSRMRLRRTLLQMSQQGLARKLGLTFQQVQKYEKGLNRIGASRLWDIARILNVPMDFFFDDMDLQTQNQSPMCLSAPEQDFAVVDTPRQDDPMQSKEALELVRAYYKINNRKLARHIFELLKDMSISNSNLPPDM